MLHRVYWLSFRLARDSESVKPGAFKEQNGNLCGGWTNGWAQPRWGVRDVRDVRLIRHEWNAPGSLAVVSCRTSSDVPDILSRRKLKQSPSDQDLPWPDWSILPSSSSSLGWLETSCIIVGPDVVAMRSKVINISQASTSIVSEVLSYPRHKHLLSPPVCSSSHNYTMFPSSN